MRRAKKDTPPKNPSSGWTRKEKSVPDILNTSNFPIIPQIMRVCGVEGWERRWARDQWANELLCERDRERERGRELAK